MPARITSDTELIRAALQGRHEAFSHLIDKYRALVCAITYSATTDLDKSEELAQKAFITAWKNLAQLRDLTKFRPWLCTLTRNIINSSFRKQKHDPINCAAHLDNIPDSPAIECQPDRHLISTEERALVAKAMQRLPELYREPLVLFYWENQSIKQVAQQLELSDQNVKQRLHRGRNLLKAQITTVVERTLTNAAPGKAFTSSVIVAISSMAVIHATQAATAAVATKTSAISIVSSTIATKIIATAATIAIAIGIATTYQVVTAKSSSKQLAAPQQSQPATTPTLSPPDTNPQTSESTSEVSLDKPVIVPSTEENQTPNDTSSQQSSVEIQASAPDPMTGITGIVIDKTTSKPIANAEAFMRTPMGNMSIKTDSDGKFKLTMNLAGMQGVPDKFEHRFSIIAKTYTTRQVSIHIAKNTISDSGKVELTPGTKIAGSVFNQEGKPIHNAKVATFQFTNHPAVTDANGKFEIDGLDPSWAAYSLHSEHPDYPSETARFSPIKAGETLYKDIIMTKGITVRGQLTDSHAKPIAGVAVGNTTSRSMWNVIEDKTDAQGNYTLHNVPPGKLVIWAINKNYAPYVENFTLDSDLKDKQIDIQLLDPTPLYGKVVDKMGNPVPHVFASIREYKGVSNLSNHRVETDAQGLFTIPNAPPDGKLILELFAEHVPNTHPELEMGRDFYRLTVDRAGKIYGKILTSDTQSPIENFTVKMTFSKAGKSGGGYAATWSRQGHTFSSNQGHFDTGTENIGIGSDYALTVYAKGFEPLEIDPVTVQAASDTADRTEFRLRPAILIKGAVVDTKGNPVPDARVRWITPHTESRHWDDGDTAITDKKGQFSIASMGKTASAIYVTAKTFSPVLFAADNLPFNEDDTLDFTLEIAPQLFGTVTDENRKPISGANVTAYPQRINKMRFPLNSEVSTDTEGFYEFHDLPTGKVTIGVIPPAPHERTDVPSQEITLESGQEKELNLRVDPGHMIFGKIPVQIQNTDDVSITVHVFHPDSLPGRNWKYDSHSVIIHANGTFTCDNLLEGLYYLSLSTKDDQHAITDIFEVTANKPIENLTFNGPTSALTIRAIDAQTGQEIPHTNFDLLNDLECQFHSKKLTTPQCRTMNTGPSATAIFDFLPAGSYRIKTYAIGYLPAESDYIELLDSDTQPITLPLTPCAAARFKLSQAMVDELGTDNTYTLCIIIDNTTGQIVPSKWDSKENKHIVYITNKTNRHWTATALNLPAGNYTIDYSLYAVEDGRYSHHLPPVKTGAETIQLTTGKTATIEVF